MGSKNRISKHLKPILEKHLNGENWYVEPFVGGANMIDKIDYKKKIGIDINEYLIALLKEMQKDNFQAPIISKELYQEIKENKDKFPKWIVGFAGTQLSFGSKWFDSYRKDKESDRNYAEEAKNNIEKQAKNIKDILFIHSDYKNINIPPKSVIYCDPPYANVTHYKRNLDFDHKKFWNWCREKVKEGHYVYVSEYNAPEDFVCIWQKEVLNGLNKTKPVEKLFVHKTQNHV